MSYLDGDSESHTLRGSIDRKSLCEFRDVFQAEEPLATAELDTPLNPDVLTIVYDTGIGDGSSGRFDIRWSTVDDYNIHYTDTDRDLRWDLHQHDYTSPLDDHHYHPSPDASKDDEDVEESCIELREVETVARAVKTAWRECYNVGSLDIANDLDNPP